MFYSFAFLVTATLYCVLQLCSLVTNTSCSSGYCPSSNNSSGVDMPPPLPSRKSLSMQSLSPPPLPPRPPPAMQNTVQPELDRHLLIHLTPSTVNHGISNSVSSLKLFNNVTFLHTCFFADKCTYVIVKSQKYIKISKFYEFYKFYISKIISSML